MSRERRSSRVVRVVPLTVEDEGRSFHACSAVINAHGALIVIPEFLAVGTPVTLINERNGARVEASIVWADSSDPPAGSSPAEYRLGVEFHDRVVGFWGEEYDD
jgi:hypothetical protein